MIKYALTRFTIVVGLVMSFCLPAPQLAYAGNYDPFGNACSSSGANSTVCNTQNASKNPLTGSNGTLLKIANILAVIAGVAAVIMIILAGFRYVTADGDDQAISNAKKSIIGALVGLIVIVLAKFLVTMVAKGL